MQIINVAENSRIPVVYDAYTNVVYNYTNKDIDNFKVINIDEDSFGNVFLMCRKDDYKFRILVKNFDNYFFVEDKEGTYKTFDDKFNVRKVFFKNNKDKKEIIDNLSFETRTFETDIKNSYRFSINYIDKFQIEEDVKKFKVLYFDIETESSVDVINTPAPIISVSFINSFDNKSVFLTWHKNVKEDIVFEKDGKQYRYYTNEVSMLKFFIEEFQKSDIVTGWNIKGFDIIYLYSRLKHLSLNADIISPVGRVYNGIKKDDDRFAGNKFRVYGIDIMDMKEMLADVIKFSLDKPTNMTLDVVAKFFLKDFTKWKLEKSISETWRDGELDKLGTYNIRDVEILTQLNAKMNLFFYYSNIRNILKCMNLADTQHNSITIDKMILTKYHDKVFPSKRYAEKIDFEGAFVMEPVEGIYNYVGIFDFNALYPNLIRTFNISPDTLVDEMNENCVVINGCYFDLSKRGILSELVDELIKTRYEYKRLKNSFVKGDDKYTVYESMETAFKAIVNSIYGVFGLNSFRLYDSRISSSITGAGRMVIKDVMNYVNTNKDFKVIGGDTDSVFVSCAKVLDYQEVKKIFLELEENLNNNVKEYLKSIVPRKYYDENKILLKLECETIFKKLILPNAKKKYVGLVRLFKGKELDKEIIYGRNIELIKRDTPDAIKKILKKLMDYLLNIDDMVDLKIKILELKSEIYNLEYKDLLISKQINKNFNEYRVKPQHIKAMLFSNEQLGTTFSRDNYKGGMIYVKSSKHPDTKVIMLDDTTEFPKEFEINYDKYFDLFVKRKIILLNSQFEVLFSENNTLTKWL